MYTRDNNEGIYIERQVRVPGFNMGYEHFHNYYEFFYLKTGSCIYSVNHRFHHLTAGEVFIVTPRDYHSTSYEGRIPCERFVVCCIPAALPELFRKKHSDLQNNIARSGKVILTPKGRQQLETLLSKMLVENNFPDEYSYEILQLQLLELLLTLQRNGIFLNEQVQQDTVVSHDIEEALQYIAQNYSMPLTLEEIAENINLTPTYLSRKFKKETGSTFKEYLNFIRVRKACQMLITTDDSVTKIAVNCGFNSSNYFKDCFRRIIGISPRAFRKQSKGHSFEYSAKSTIDQL